MDSILENTFTLDDEEPTSTFPTPSETGPTTSDFTTPTETAETGATSTFETPSETGATSNFTVETVRQIKEEDEKHDLMSQNAELAAMVDKATADLSNLETLNGKKQYPIPGKETKETTAPPAEDVPIDVRKLDFRIGKIVEINKHPNADSLYVEKIDCGEEQSRTVVSGLVSHVPIDEMRDRFVMVLCNLKPVKMRGVISEAMVMCASNSEKVEVLTPPNGAIPGDLVLCEGYPREPEPQLNPKKRIFETCSLDLKTNDDKVACYKGSPLVVPGKGPIVAATLKDVLII